MTNNLSKVQYLLFALLLMAMTGCGASNLGGTAATPGNGSITAKLQWGADGKTTAKSVALPAAVAKIRFTVTGAGVPIVRSEITTAGATSGQVDGVYPGTVTLAVQGLDATGAILYEGFALNVVVAAGATSDVGTINMTVPTVKTADAPCLGCHETTTDVTGQNLVADFKQSGHYTNLAWTANAKSGVTGTGCAGCHGPQHNDVSPATNGRCFECHGANLSLKHTSATALVAGETNPARYINLTGTNCSACHEPHNPINGVGKLQREQWGTSGHGDINAWPWAHYDFTTRDTCNSCHTSAGFTKAMGNNFTDKTALSTTTLGKQPLTCDACHSSNDFKNSVRTLATGFVAPYTATLATTAGATFPNGGFVGNSQICIPCHTGLSSGKNVEISTANMAASDFGTFNSHYMTAAGTMYVKNGFTAFTSASAPVKVNGVAAATSSSSNIPLFTSAGVFSKYTTLPVGYVYTYGKTLTSTSDLGAVSSTHRILGTPAMANDSHVGGRGLITGGPCVTCHMPKAGHTWEINADSFNNVCVNCHTSEGTTILTAANFKTVFVEEQAVPFQNALKVAFSLMSTNYHIAYNAGAYPYFYKAGIAVAYPNRVTDWTIGGTLTAAQTNKLVGAAFNLNLLNREPAAYVHARTYTRRLLYDTIDFLDDMAMNMSVTATAQSKYPADYGATIPATADIATSSLSYLKAYNRTGNAWYGSERP